MKQHALKATTAALITTLLLGGCATYTGQTNDPNDPNRTRNVAGGYFEEDCEVWDSTGRLVAQSRQLAGMPRAAND